MFFQSKKKRLWRARLKQSAANSVDITAEMQQPPHHPLHQRLHPLPPTSSLPHPQYFYQTQNVHQSQKFSNYQSYSNCFGQSAKGEELMEETLEDYNITDGYYCENCGESSTDYNEDVTMNGHYQTKQRQLSPVPPSPVTLATTVAATAASVFRNCCGGGGGGGGGNCVISNNNSRCFQLSSPPHSSVQMINDSDSDNSVVTLATTNKSVDIPKKMFLALIGKLKERQLTTLIQAVDNRQSGGGSDCVLVPRGLIMGQEPNVIACRLWGWIDLKNSTELKRYPDCPNGKDRIYVCCNPTHWSRLTLPDTPPPPYQSSTMERLQPEAHGINESLKDVGNTCMSTSTNSYTGGLRVPFPTSLPTDGEGTLSPQSTWCQLAYWELAQRVGKRFLVDNPSINIFSDQTHGDGMCLKLLADEKKTSTPESVLKTRQKIGLGITLSQESDGVWLYNRSSAAVFVHSPTLNDIDCWFHVSKVPPGYCLKAFDNYRARTQSLKWPPQIAGAQTGPVDTHSMRISFAKGWGPNYSRQDVTACPCWLEVIFTRR